MRNRLTQFLGIALPIIGLIINIADSINQAYLQEEELKAMEERIVTKYGLKEAEHVEVANED